MKNPLSTVFAVLLTNDVCHFIFVSCKIFSNNFYVFSVKVTIVKNGEFPDIHGSSRYDFVSDI